MKFKANLFGLQIDMTRYRQAMHDELSEEIARLAFVWIEAVLTEIPVWSGASWATFLRLSREIGYSLQINPKVTSRISYGQRSGDGEITTDPKKGLYTFSYSTDLRWLVHNEYNSPESDPNVFATLHKPGPYHFQAKGVAAFRKEVGSVRLPSPWKYLKKTKLKV